MKITSSITGFMNYKWMFLFVCTFCAGTIHAQTIQTTCSSIQYVGSTCDVTIPIGYSLSGSPSLPPVYSTSVSGGYKTFTFIWNVVANRTYTINLLDEPDGGGGGSGILDSYAVTVYNHVGSVTIGGASTMCQSVATSAFTASASNAASYAWDLTPASAGTIAYDGVVTWNGSFVGTATVGVYAYGASGDYSTSSKTITRTALETFTASMNAPAQVCEGVNFSLSANASHSATYAWYRDDVNTIISTSSSIFVPAQLPNKFTVKVTPSGGNCLVSSATITVIKTVPVTPQVYGLQIVNPTVTVCTTAGMTTQYNKVVFSADSYSWTLTPGAGQISTEGLVTWDPTFNGTATVTVNAGGCNFSTATASVNVYVRALPQMNNTAGELNPAAVCGSVAVNFAPTSNVAIAQYSWTSSATSNVSGANSGGGNVINTLSLTNSQTGTVTYTITPNNGVCIGSPEYLTINLKPIPVIVTSTSPVCEGAASVVGLTSPVANTTFNWTVQLPMNNISNGTSGTSLTQINNPLTLIDHSLPGSVQYNLTATANGCSATPVSVTASVNPIPQITNTAPQLQQTVCGNVTLNFAPSSSVASTQFNWTSSPTSNITGATSGVGTLNNSLTLTNSQIGSVVYVITPSKGTCIGTSQNFTATLKPIPTVSTTTSPVCEGAASIIGLTSTVANTTFNWTVTQQTNISNGTSGSSITQINSTLVLTNHSIPGSVLYSVIGTANSCPSAQVSATANVNPIPSITNAAGQFQQTIFNGTALNFVPTSSVGSTNYSWASSTAGSLTGVTSSGTTAITDSPQTSIFSSTATYHIIPTAGTCPGSAKDLVVSVYAKPIISSSSQRLNLGEDVILQTVAGYDSYVWKNQASATLGSGQSYTTHIADTYSVTVTKNAVSATSPVFVLGDQFSGINKNYIIANKVLQSGVPDEATVNSLTVEGRSQQIQYIDGLGRAEQVVSTEQSSLKKDIVQSIAYDLFGRQAQNYLPFVSTEGNGRFKDGAVALQNQFYSGSAANVATDARPFSETIFEPSPLNRPSKQYGPGQGWKDPNLNIDKFIEHQYLINQSSEVLLFAYDITTGLVSRANGAGGYYEAGQLRANNTIDEQGNEVIEYADKQGHTVCKKVQYGSDGNGKLYASTYYLYDDFGNLVVVLPPEAVKNFEINEQ